MTAPSNDDGADDTGAPRRRALPGRVALTAAIGLAVLVAATIVLLALGTAGADIANVLALPFTVVATLASIIALLLQDRDPSPDSAGARDAGVQGDSGPRRRRWVVALGGVSALTVVYALLLQFGVIPVVAAQPEEPSPPQPPAGSCVGIAVTDRPVQLPGCSSIPVTLPGRWVVEARSTGAPCMLDLDGSPPRSTQGREIVIHGRSPGIRNMRPTSCAVTIRPGDDLPQDLPVELDTTARSGATPLFQASRLITVDIRGDSPKCTASLYDDTGTKVGRQATLTQPLQINVDGIFWVETQVDGCSLTVR